MYKFSFYFYSYLKQHNYVLPLLTLGITYVGTPFCADSVEIQQDGQDQITYETTAIIPRFNFTCNGRITVIRARVRRENQDNFSFFQVWRPSSTSSITYNRIGEVQLSHDQVAGNGTYRTANIILTGNNRIEVQSGDVVGYYREIYSRYRLRTIQTDGYIQYEFDGTNTPTSVNLNNADRNINKRQPLIEFIIGMCVYSITVVYRLLSIVSKYM